MKGELASYGTLMSVKRYFVHNNYPSPFGALSVHH